MEEEPENKKRSNGKFAGNKDAEGGAIKVIGKEWACFLRVSMGRGRTIIVAHHEPVVAQHHQTHDTTHTVEVLSLLVGCKARWSRSCCWRV